MNIHNYVYTYQLLYFLNKQCLYNYTNRSVSKVWSDDLSLRLNFGTKFGNWFSNIPFISLEI